jgi:hypothetical protein
MGKNTSSRLPMDILDYCGQHACDVQRTHETDSKILRFMYMREADGD